MTNADLQKPPGPVELLHMGPIELSRMHEAELKRCYKQYGILGALIRQIMVGRTITVSTSVPIEVTDIKLKDGKIQVYGKSSSRRRGTLVCEGLAGVTIVAVEPTAKPESDWVKNGRKPRDLPL